jgi:hypothetical protein
MSTRRAQAWYMDFIFAMIIFTGCIILFYSFFPNVTTQELTDLDDVYLDGRVLSSALLSSGYPTNWTNTTVQRIGIIDDRRLNITKYALFASMTSNDYYRVKDLFNLRADFVVFFQNETGGVTNMSGIHHIGHPDVSVGSVNAIDLEAVPHNNLVTFTRVIGYNGLVQRMVIYVWD